MLDNFNPVQDLIDTVNLLSNRIAQLENQISDVVSGSITTGNIANGAITESKLANGSVTENKIADGAVTESKLANGAVTESKLADHSVSVNKLTEDLYSYLTRKATTSQSGLVELSTDAEVIAMTDLERVLTPSNLSAFLNSLGLSGNLASYRIFNGDLNTLITTGIWFYVTECTNKPPTWEFTYSIIEVFSEDNSNCVQRATSIFNGKQTNRRHRSGDITVWTNWNNVVYADDLQIQVTTIGNDTTALWNSINAINANLSDYSYVTEHNITAGNTLNIFIPSRKGFRVFMLGGGGGGGQRDSSSSYGHAGTDSFVDIGADRIFTAGGGGGGQDGSYRYVNGVTGSTGVATINQWYSRYITVLNANEGKIYSPIHMNGYGLGGPPHNYVNPNQGQGGDGGIGGYIDAIFYNTNNWGVTITVGCGVGGWDTANTAKGTDGYVVVYT